MTATDQAGAFHFGDVAAGSYNVTVAAGGFAVWTANVTAGVLNQAPVAAVLQVAPMTSTIEVTPPLKELAAEQVKSEEKQRVLGVFPHFLVTYEPNAAPLTAGQKFHPGVQDPGGSPAEGVEGGERVSPPAPAVGRCRRSQSPADPLQAAPGLGETDLSSFFHLFPKQLRHL